MRLARVDPLIAVVVSGMISAPGRALAVVLAIAIGVGMGLAIYLINRTALDEFSGAVQFLIGEADYELHAGRDGFDEAAWPRIARLPEVAAASPVVDVNTRVERRARAAPAADAAESSGEAYPERRMLRVLGIDLFRMARLNTRLIPLAGGEADPQASARDTLADLLGADAVFLSPAALAELDTAVGEYLGLRVGDRLRWLRVAGTLPGVPAGQRVAAMDIGAAQWQFDRLGVLHRIDVKLAQGVDESRARRALADALPAGVEIATAQDAGRRTSNLSLAYRVNLNVLALVALFTGAFLVYSTQSLSVHRRRSQLALLRTLGATRATLARLLLAEAAALGLLGSLLGCALGVAAAAAAIARFGGDLGGGFFPGIAPELSVDPAGLALFGLLGIAAAVAGALLPVLTAARTPLAGALRAQPQDAAEQLSPARVLPGLGLLAVAALLCVLPPRDGLPLAGYAAVLMLLLGGVALTPAIGRAVFATLDRLAAGRDVPAWLALALARASAASGMTRLALASVVASFAVMVAMGIMVSSFRDSVDRWLVTVLPADLYLRTAGGSDTGWLAPAELAALSATPGVARVEPLAVSSLPLEPGRPAVALIARPLDPADPGARLPLVGRAQPAPPGLLPVYPSEPMARIYRLSVGDRLTLAIGGQPVEVFVAAVWRDYARHYGALALDLEDYRRRVPGARVSDAALWLEPGASAATVVDHLAMTLPGFARIELSEPGAIREQSLRIFDRSFAITYLLEAVAVVIGLLGVAATFSAEALSRRREFGLQRALGMPRRAIAAQLATEGALFAALGAAVGGTVGFAISLLLVEVINPQSFHWTMDLATPWGLLGILATLLVALAAVTAVVAGRAALAAATVGALREDW